MTFRVLIKNHERGLLFKRCAFQGVLGPGVYRPWPNLWERQAEEIAVLNTLETYIKHPLLDTFSSRADFPAEATVLSLSDTERALVWRDERLAFILGPGRHALWKAPLPLRVETFDTATMRF